ncbi:hypothetical protein AVEN_101155-1 [Araneus ventricosus]|uniref:Uncharacterized protein n=1 Tax=Araneus ventricosus TaxID=182803 RepID=A0A4Y2DEP6_ARAVE|nr:hypothetical protein AVEN_101155-1 [Araneus ventricosus]
MISWFCHWKETLGSKVQRVAHFPTGTTICVIEIEPLKEAGKGSMTSGITSLVQGHGKSETFALALGGTNIKIKSISSTYGGGVKIAIAGDRECETVKTHHCALQEKTIGDLILTNQLKRRSCTEVWLKRIRVIERALLYGPGVWDGDLTIEQMGPLQTIQRVFLIKLLRPYRTTATQVLNILAGIPPLLLKGKHDFLKFQIWTCRSGREEEGGLDGLIDINNLGSHLLLPEINLNNRVLDTPEKVNDNSFEVYTDGSNVGVGFSVCILKDEIQQKILSYNLITDNTDFQAELVALGEAAGSAVEINNKINIFSDSRSSIDALKGHRTKPKFVNGIKENFRLAEGLVGLAWVLMSVS